MEGRRGRDGYFRGLKLSDAEKASVKQVHEKYRDENKALRESMRPAMETIRAARQKGDTAAAKAAFSTTAGARDKMKALRDREQAEIRAALSPENQKLFDANVQAQAKRRDEFEQGGRRGEGHGRGEHKGGRKG